MGLTHVTVKLSTLNGHGPKTRKKPFEALFLVDTGAVDCLAPKDKLLAAGIKREGKSVYELANGEKVSFEYGFARVEFMGSQTATKVLFGEEGVEPILGVIALESTGIIVDPRTNTLKRLPAIPLK